MDKDVDNVHTKTSGNWNAGDDRGILQMYQTIHVAYGPGYMDVIDVAQRESLLMGMPAGGRAAVYCCRLAHKDRAADKRRTNGVQMYGHLSTRG